MRTGSHLIFRPAMIALAGVCFQYFPANAAPPAPTTTVSIVGDAFHINGEPTYKGRVWKGHKIEGLLINARLVQGIFDDLNPDTVPNWAYPDTGRWDAQRNTREFMAAMPEWRRYGLLAFTINFQGGSPRGYVGGSTLAQFGIRRRRLAPAGLCRPARTHHQPRRRVGHGRNPRLFLLGPRPALERRSGGPPRSR